MVAEDSLSLPTRIERGQAAAMLELAAVARPVAAGWMTCRGVGASVNKACGPELQGGVPSGTL